METSLCRQGERRVSILWTGGLSGPVLHEKEIDWVSRTVYDASNVQAVEPFFSMTRSGKGKAALSSVRVHAFLRGKRHLLL
jgi:hypothetical protein